MEIFWGGANDRLSLLFFVFFENKNCFDHVSFGDSFTQGYLSFVEIFYPYMLFKHNVNEKESFGSVLFILRLIFENKKLLNANLFVLFHHVEKSILYSIIIMNQNNPSQESF